MVSEGIGVPRIDPAEVVKEICGFVRNIVDGSGAGGVVLGLSGGVDSSVTASLCVRALGSGGVLALIMPTEFTPKIDVEDAVELARRLKIKHKLIWVDGVLRSFLEVLPYKQGEQAYRMPRANLIARVRMCMLYYYANLMHLLVAGSGDKSELLLGYYTKHGDGGVDLLPIGHLYKSQVRLLAEWLGLPRRIAYKPSSPQLYPEHRAVDELPADYPVLDRVLTGLFELRLEPGEVARRLKVPEGLILEVVNRYRSTAHKRRMPPMVKPLPTL